MISTNFSYLLSQRQVNLEYLSLSLGHALNHLSLDGAVAVVLAVEVLRLGAHAVASVTDNWDLHFRVVGHLLLLALLVRGHSNLETSRHRLEVLIRSHVSVLQTGTHRVNIEEWILSVLYVRHRLPVITLLSMITNCW